MTRIFVSYSSKNRDLVNRLVELLTDAGYDVNYDQQIRNGKWWEQILADIRACDIFLYAVSAEYLDSYPCDVEYRYAETLRRPMCPVRITTTLNFNQTPPYIAETQVHDLSNLESATAFVKLQRALNDLKQQIQPLPKPLPAEPPAPLSNLDDVIETLTNFSTTLNHDEQTALLNKIRPFLRDDATYDNARYVLTRFLKRASPDAPRDLYTDVAEEITFLLRMTGAGSTPATPSSNTPTATPAAKEKQTATTAPNNAVPRLRPVLIGAAVLIVLVLLGGLALSQMGNKSTLTNTPPARLTAIPDATTPGLPPTAPPNPLSVAELANTADAQDTLNAANTLTQIAHLWTSTPTANVSASVAAFRTERVAANSSQTAMLWTKTSTPTPTATGTPTSTFTPTITPTLGVGSGRTDNNAIQQVYVPAGCFMMGSDPTKDTKAHADEQPQHKVCFTHGYWLDQFDVTNAAFDAFVTAGGYSHDAYWSADGLKWRQTKNITGPETDCTQYSSQPQQPRVCVSFYEAEAYAKWRGGRLPTEAEWEYAARGPADLIYPWGNSFDPAKANTSENRTGQTTLVNSYPNGKSWVNAYDMAGNVWQWVADWYAAAYYQSSLTNDPAGPTSGQYHVLRGGSWNYTQDFARGATRGLSPELRSRDSGFRVVLPV